MILEDAARLLMKISLLLCFCTHPAARYLLLIMLSPIYSQQLILPFSWTEYNKMPCVCNPTSIIELVSKLKKVSLTENTKLLLVVAHTYNPSNQKFGTRAT